MGSKHTPGPWEWRDKIYDDYSDEGGFARVGAPEGEHIMWLGSSEMYEHQCGEPPTMADTYLIAAAPDLLEACRKALRHFDTSETVNDPEDNAVLRQLEAAISKAKGE